LSKQNFNDFYNNERAILDKKFAELFKSKKPKSLYEPIDYIIYNGGKRLRPILVLLSCIAAGGKKEDAYNAAMAVEILHNFTLVHDDIMDNATKRRGLPTIHKKYDLSTAILAGDSMVGFAYHYLLIDCKDNDKSILNTFTNGIIEVCEGQALDKEFENRDDVLLKEYLTMIKKKTAALSEMCCSIGAQIAKADEDTVNALAFFGNNLGMAFQIQDDLLDIFGDEKEFGKKVGGDLLEAKKTYLFLKALEKATGEEKNLFLKVIEQKGAKKQEIPLFKELYFKLGIIEDAKKAINTYTKKALKSLDIIKSDLAKEYLSQLAYSLIKRTK
jgi:geranylgeranyl diphosphate synthase type II